ncbi:MAG: hypothetical protein RR458_02165 [Clostridia bacterium]
MKKSRKAINSLSSKDVVKNVISAVKNNIGTFLVAVVCAFFTYIILSL